MPSYSYQIGTTYGGLANVESLTEPLPAPKSTFRPYKDPILLGSGAIRGAGSPVATWRWGFLSQAQRDQMRTFCTGASASIYINTRKVDSSDAYQVYTATMIWPEEEEKDASRRLDFVIVFHDLIEYSP